VILTVTAKVRCPHCGKNVTVNLDLAQPEDTWIDDCPLCKEAVQFSSQMEEGRLEVTAGRLGSGTA
jgi:endogenous inhibitor of DNA gyrase (YacG/DUF329 family)